MTTTTATELTKFLVAEYPGKGATWVMKVVYYTQGWRFAWDGEPMFRDAIEAWDLGPVAPAAYTAFYTYSPVGRSVDKPSWTLPERLESVARSVASYYSQFSARALVEATHRELPWSSTYGTSPSLNSRGSNPTIKESDMKDFFTQRAALQEARPARPATTPSSDSWDIDMAALDAFTKGSAQRWSEALDLLAR